MAALILLFGLGSTQSVLARPKKGKQASSAKPTVAVLPIEGPNTSKLRAAATTALSKQKKKVKTASKSNVDAALDQSGADPNSAAGRVAIARQLTASALVGGELRKRGKKVELRLDAYDGASGEVLGSATFKGNPAAVQRQVRQRLWSKLGKPITRGKAPAAAVAATAARPPQPSGAAEEEEAADELAEDESLDELEEETPSEDVEAEQVAERESGAAEEARVQAPLELSLGVRLMTRSYEYNEDPSEQLAEHTLHPTPALRLEARWYPAAHFTTGVIANLGVDAYAQFMWPVTAESKIGDFDTSSTAFGIAGRFRIPIGKHELGILVGYSTFGFYFEDAENAQAQVPSVTYGSIRLGGDARFQITDNISAGLQASYLLVQSFGELGTPAWWEDVTGSGLELELRGGYAISKPLELTLAFGLTRYGMAFNVDSDDIAMNLASMRAVGGLLDQYFHGALGIRWVF